MAVLNSCHKHNTPKGNITIESCWTKQTTQQLHTTTTHRARPHTTTHIARICATHITTQLLRRATQPPYPFGHGSVTIGTGPTGTGSAFFLPPVNKMQLNRMGSAVNCLCDLHGNAAWRETKCGIERSRAGFAQPVIALVVAQ